MVENLNKNIYKAFLISVKLLPIGISAIFIINSILSLINIDLPFLSYVGGMSILPLTFLYLTSYLFKFCFYHRIYLHYISLNVLLSIIDNYTDVFVNYRTPYVLCIILFCLTTFISVYSYVKYNRKRIR